MQRGICHAWIISAPKLRVYPLLRADVRSDAGIPCDVELPEDHHAERLVYVTFAQIVAGTCMGTVSKVRPVWAAFALLFFVLMGVGPARAEYCETIDWGFERFPDGTCSPIHRTVIDWGARRSQLTLLLENEAAGGLSDHRLGEIRHMIGEVANAVGSGLRRIPGARLQDTVHMVIVNDHAGGARAETNARSDGVSDCAIMIYDSASTDLGVLARSLTHEMFHCVQYNNWPAKAARSDSRWWTEGSAEWFEDFAMPERVGDSDLRHNLSLFRERSTTHSLLENQYANVVFFIWLGAPRMVSYISGLAEGSMSQLEGASRAMPESEYRHFAQDYVDERIVSPSGVEVAGSEFGPVMTSLHTTTGVPRADPDYYSPATVPALTLVRGTITFVPGEYQPTGFFAVGSALRGTTPMFSQARGSWTSMPSPLSVACGSPKTIRVATMSLHDGVVFVKPDTQRRANLVCSCPAGDWTISDLNLESLSPSPDYQLHGHGDVVMSFHEGHARFAASNLRFDGPVKAVGQVRFQVTIVRSYEASWTYSTSGDRITMSVVEPLRITERKTHSTTAPYGSSTQRFPARVSTPEPNPNPDENMFICKENRLIISPPISKFENPDRYSDRPKLRYPRYGVYVRS